MYIFSGPTAFQLYFDNQKSTLVEEAGDLPDTELAMMAARRFKELPAEEKQVRINSSNWFKEWLST